MSIGGVLGGYVGAKFSLHELAKKWTYRMLVGIMVFELFHIFDLLYSGTLLSGAVLMNPLM